MYKTVLRLGAIVIFYFADTTTSMKPFPNRHLSVFDFFAACCFIFNGKVFNNNVISEFLV